MKLKIYSISLLLIFLVALSHGLIPHHHDLNWDKISSHFHHVDKNSHNDETHHHHHEKNNHHHHDSDESEDDHKHPFPDHQHLISDNGFKCIKQKENTTGHSLLVIALITS